MQIHAKTIVMRPADANDGLVVELHFDDWPAAHEFLNDIKPYAVNDGPNWDRAPTWARYWAVVNKHGDAYWLEDKPRYSEEQGCYVFDIDYVRAQPDGYFTGGPRLVERQK